jgi:type IV secretion system protein VirD4
MVGGPEHGALILGPPRSGKTTALVVPNVLAAPGAVVSTSTKTDVLVATALARSRVGRCWLYDPSGTVEVAPGLSSLRWSPVTAGATWDGALLMARAMVRAARPGRGLTDASHWTERAEALLAPLLHAAARTGADTATLMGWVNKRDASPALDALVSVGGGPSTAVDLLGGIAATDPRELSGIWSTASGVLAGYRSDAALAGSRTPNFDAADFVAATDTVYVCATGRHQDLVAPLVVGLLEDIRAAAYERAGAPGHRRAPTLLALDEVANIAPLADLPSIVAEGGGQGLLTLACLQDLSQARARWGDEADGLLSLFGATVVLPGIGDVRTLQAISARCGDREVAVRSDTRGKSGRRGRSRSITWTTRREPRLGVDDAAEGRPGHALVIGGPRPPMWVGMTPWYATEPWRTIAGRNLGPSQAVATRGGGPPRRTWSSRVMRGEGLRRGRW